MSGQPPPDLDPLHPSAITVWRVGGVARGLGLALAVLIIELVVGSPLPVGVGAGAMAALTVLHAVVVPPLRYRAWGYVVRATDVYLRYGILFRTTSIVPHARIQHVDTQHGPIDRWLGLADLVIFTAGSRGASIALPSLSRDTAEELRDRLAALSGAGDAV